MYLLLHMYFRQVLNVRMASLLYHDGNGEVIDDGYGLFTNPQ